MLGAIALVLLQPAHAAGRESHHRRRSVGSLLRDRALRGTRTAIYIADACTGRPLYARDADLPVNPASNVKLLSTAAALEVLGPSYVFRTRLLGRTPDADGVVHGDLYLLGSYDPMLSPEQVSELAEVLRQAGVRRVEGSILIGTRRTRDGIYRSSVVVRVDGRGRHGATPMVTVSPTVDFVDVIVRASIASRGSRTSIRVRSDEVVGAGGKRVRLVVSGRVARGRVRDVRHELADHALFAGHLVRAALVGRGIQVIGGVTTMPLESYMSGAGADVPVTLAEHESPPLRDLVSIINKFSVNWLAERLIHAAGAAEFGGRATLDNAVGAMKAWLRRSGVVEDNVYLDSGSGLSYRTAISARQIVEVLRAGTGLGGREGDVGTEAYEAFWESLPIGGVDGTLAHRFRDSPLGRRIRAKTGTLSTVVAISGFFPRMETGEPIAFAIISNDVRPRRRRRVMALHERILEELHRQSRDGLGRPEAVGACTLPGPKAR
jgi:serine-type D-Ala-D-Ala carboxypeptidase/endopeptidase (penicillin-binding protein 4)